MLQINLLLIGFHIKSSCVAKNPHRMKFPLTYILVLFSVLVQAQNNPPGTQNEL